ncbi:maltodextrin ABC transporter ATP-binding protein [Haploplasma axanthum]|uniref:Maltodextrin ABC transporter ATP-binding protein n=1 Tax=Haploplasma axanthum TaxID=29552 RepID=A0A449BFC1_HAPAX|nr:sn-glycerol-3-phosphate ABC transporter ATP-binding protein UgpC [Haploplasma axanthum]VEU81136.1 maltodextrin ABC transporter ATP-binding protein [Haploplasma axanthum]
MATLLLKDLNKVYPNGVQAVFDFNLEIKDKEFIVLVGPSGCGKSTTLRMVAGLEDISSGELYIDQDLVNDQPPKDRNIAMVFQSYALYPHMTVYDNMAFGLKLRKMPKAEIEEKVMHAAKILGLTEYLKRKPKALSGGQRQRVALGRAIVRNAKVFLMDEPLSNLDAKLRVQMRGELIKLHRQIETTTIYVTHDQIEAMTMADRIVVMDQGYIQQVDTPKNIYDGPINKFVAGFMGTPPMNFLNVVVNEKGEFTINGQTVKLPKKQIKILEDFYMINKEVTLGIRPEDLHLGSTEDERFKDTTVKVTVDVAELLGSETNIYTTLNESNVCAVVNAKTGIQMGNQLELALDPEKVHFFDIETDLRLRYENGKPISLEDQPHGIKRLKFANKTTKVEEKTEKPAKVEEVVAVEETVVEEVKVVEPKEEKKVAEKAPVKKATTSKTPAKKTTTTKKEPAKKTTKK